MEEGERRIYINRGIVNEEKSIFLTILDLLPGADLIGDARREKSRAVNGEMDINIGSLSRTVLSSLETIKEELYAGKFPSNNHMWNLNQLCAKTHMFGQYVSRIFYVIK